jgi:hypothetical protein
MKSTGFDILDGLPGSDLVREGIADHRAGRKTIANCLVRIASPRLFRAGLVDSEAIEDNGTELELYQLLADEGNRAYSRYNSLLREIISFEHALDHRLRKPNPCENPH